MTKKEANAFRKMLELKQTELKAANQTQPIAIEAVSDEIDRIQHTSERDYAVSSLERNFRRLREVNVALQRLDAGTFGICGNCKQEIGPKRLAALPWAAFCIVCQEVADNQPLTPLLETEASLLAEA